MPEAVEHSRSLKQALTALLVPKAAHLKLSPYKHHLENVTSTGRRDFRIITRFSIPA
jgi:hypothetical protein